MWNSKYVLKNLGLFKSSKYRSLVVADDHISQPNTSRKFSTNFAETSECEVFRPKRVLILSKLTRFEYEKRTHPGLNAEQLKLELLRRGSDYWQLLDRHQRHTSFLEVIKKELNNAKIEVRVVERSGYDDVAVRWADAIFAAGGDGTFLLAASRVTNNKKPVIGINTDPGGSEGYLSLYQNLARESFRGALEKLLRNDFRWLYRQRIRIKLRGDADRLKYIEMLEQRSNLLGEEKQKQLNDLVLPRPGYKTVTSSEHELVLPELALNDVFVGEIHSSRVSYHKIQIDDSKPVKQKSSGITVCTGTGSTSWFFNINKLSGQSVSDLLKIAAEELSVTLPYDDSQVVDRICRIFNGRLTFSPADKRMAYSIRDPIHNSIYKPFPSRGFANKIHVQSRCYDAHLVIDGGVAYRFNDGCDAILEIHPQDALKTAVIR